MRKEPNRNGGNRISYEKPTLTGFCIGQLTLKPDAAIGTKPVSSQVAQIQHFIKQTMIHWAQSEPLIQTFDTADVGILHKLRVFVCHWHETWRERKNISNLMIYHFLQSKTESMLQFTRVYLV